MQISLANFNTVNFKGYDACPLKTVYMQGMSEDGHVNIFKELKKIGEIEDFNVCHYDGISKISSKEDDKSVRGHITRWAQDDKTFVEGKKKKIIIDSKSRYYNYVFAKLLDATLVADDNFKVGGNCFIGKKPNGDKWMIIGENDKPKNESELQNVSKIYGVKPENIHIISQPNFHLDMSIRPIGYPYVLVNDENIALQNAKGDKELEYQIKNRNADFRRMYDLDKKYASADKTVRELQQAGFIPIRIGGVYASGINYMNAIVNQHPDGTISYITNSARNSFIEYTDAMFEKELKEKVPNLKYVYFVSGGLKEDDIYPNPMMEHLQRLQGGIHCMTLEEPNFDKWA